MSKITTGKLTDILMQSGLSGFSSCVDQYRDEFATLVFIDYFQQTLSKKGVSRRVAIKNSGIEIHYGYQILGGLKKPGRDKLICLCIGGGFDLKETQKALNIAGLGQLYPRKARDAAIMLAIDGGIRDIWKVNDILEEHGLPLLT